MESDIPFKLRWVWGMNNSSKFINLTRNKDECVIFYAVSHVGVIYDYKSKTFKYLFGHKYIIRRLSSDESRKWLVTACEETDSKIIIWNREDCAPVRIIHRPHKNFTIADVAISNKGKYLVTVGKETNPTVKIWLWTYGRDNEDDSSTLSKDFGVALNIAFNMDKDEHFMVTFKNNVVFFTWENNSLTRVVPEIRNRESRSYGSFIRSVYMRGTDKCFTATNTGWLVIWANTLITTENSAEVSNNKLFVKAVRLQNNGILSLTTVNQFLVTVCTKGQIKFYNDRLHLQYWCQKFSSNPVIEIKFHMDESNNFAMENESSIEKEPCIMENINEQQNNNEDMAEEIKQFYSNIRPRRCTLKTTPLVVPDFIILLENGEIYYIDFMKDECQLIKEKFYTVMCLDSHKEKPFIYLGCENGVMRIMNYETYELVAENDLTKTNYCKCNISTIKMCPEGLQLVCGTTTGEILLLDPFILAPKTPAPIKYGNSPILCICFSTDNKYFAYSDESITVTLFKCYKEGDKTNWVMHGRVSAHEKPITGIIFVEISRLLSFSQDRYAVEYDANGSVPHNLDVVSRIRILQTAFPTSVIYMNSSHFGQKDLIVTTTSWYKFCLFVYPTYQMTKATLTEFNGDIMRQIAILRNGNNYHVIFRDTKYVGIQTWPITGNPFESVSMILSGNNLADFSISGDGLKVFTTGVNENCCFIWDINTEAVSRRAAIGGPGLTPFLYLIEGGETGQLYRELQDLFYYIQILQKGEDSPLPTKSSDKILTKDIPSFLRALGCYPTEFQIHHMMEEALTEHGIFSENSEPQITFESLMKLYVNYRPRTGTTIDKLKRAFNYFAKGRAIDRESFYKIFCTDGEAFTPEIFNEYLRVLMRDYKNKDEFHKTDLPKRITFDYFIYDILGVDAAHIENGDNETEN